MNNLSLKIKKKLKKRKGLLNVIKTYKTQGPVESLIELIFLIMLRLKTNPGKFIISRQAIYLHKESKHLNSLEKILVHKKSNDNIKSMNSAKKYLQFETI